MKTYTSPNALLALALAALAAACNVSTEAPGDGGSDAPARSDAPAGAHLPCAVDAVLAARCRACHSSPMQFGAPMPLTTWADTQAPAVTDHGQTVAEMMHTRINSTARPMPPANSPTGPLSAAERAALDGWLTAGGAADTGPACGAPDGGGPTGDGGGGGDGGVQPPLPCTPNQTFRAFGNSANTGFAVPSAGSDLYQCFVLATPFAAGEQAIALGPVLDDTRVVHHMILYSAPAANASLTPGTSFDCTGNMPPGATFVWGWAPGSQGLIMPDNIGLHLPGADQRLLLQIHYSNAAGLTDAVDRSGVQMCTVTTPRAEEAGFLRLGVTGFAIPAHQVGYQVNGECPIPAAAGTLSVLGAAPHMHRTGVAIETDIYRGGAAAQSETLIRVDPWDWNAQSFYPLATELHGGDVLRTSCRYTNVTDAAIRNGERTSDEMCLDFVLVHPYATLLSARRTACLSPPVN